MRHRFHAICPYFAMFPEAFVEEHLAASPHQGVVFDPFCGRGTTVFQALLKGREAAGCDVNPVAVCVSGAKCDPPNQKQVETRLMELRDSFSNDDEKHWEGEYADFFQLCFHRDTLPQVLYLRSVLNWRGNKVDRFIAALCLGALHGESHHSPSYFSNRMPRTISTKPNYSVGWWQRNGYKPPQRNIFQILERMTAYRFQTPPPEQVGNVRQVDVRKAGQVFRKLKSRVSDVITSPPYLNTTNYREDQWLRLWFLGDDHPLASCNGGDDRHHSEGMYWAFLQSAWAGIAPLLSQQVRLVIRIGSRQQNKVTLREGLVQSLTQGLNRPVNLVNEGLSSKVVNTQANSFRGSKVSQFTEHDFLFNL